VAIAGRTVSTGERACQGLRALGVDAFFVRCDVADAQQTRQVISAVARRLGRIDVAINNAGCSGTSGALDMDEREWCRTLDVNLTGLFWCAQAEAQQMSTQAPMGGKIINIASMYATVPGGTCAYNASKAGVVHLTRSLACEWGSYNINVNCISPGWMLTPGNPITPPERERMRTVTPLGSLMRYEDIYGAVIYLASGASDFVTGHELTVDGGHTVTNWAAPTERHASARISPEEEEAGMRADQALQGS